MYRRAFAEARYGPGSAYPLHNFPLYYDEKQVREWVRRYFPTDQRTIHITPVTPHPDLKIPAGICVHFEDWSVEARYVRIRFQVEDQSWDPGASYVIDYPREAPDAPTKSAVEEAAKAGELITLGHIHVVPFAAYEHEADPERV